MRALDSSVFCPATRERFGVALFVCVGFAPACSPRLVEDASADSDASTDSGEADTESSEPSRGAMNCSELCDTLFQCGLTDELCTARACAQDGSLRPEGPLGEAQLCLSNLAPRCESLPDCITITVRFAPDLEPSCLGCATNETAAFERDYLDEACTSARLACHGGPGCKALLACRNFCNSDASCETGCDARHPMAVAPLQAMLQCAICDACADECSMTSLAQQCG